jgi:DNA-binding MltR family transcriptional regulator
VAKRPKEPPDIRSLFESFRRFTNQPDRGTALIAAAWLDDSLEEYIRVVAFRPDDQTAKMMLRTGGPLGSFATRTNIAYLLHLIEPKARRDLESIRDVRNTFAHSRSHIRFSTPTIRDRCRRLHGAYACELAGWRLRGPKQKFIMTSFMLAQYLLRSTTPPKREPLLGETDFYGAWVRRTMKSAMISFTAAELEKLKMET